MIVANNAGAEDNIIVANNAGAEGNIIVANNANDEGNMMIANTEKKIIFMGSSPFAAAVLAGLYDMLDGGGAGNIVAVYSQPPRPQQRGKKIEKTMVQVEAEKKSCLVRTPTKFDATEVEFLSAAAPDLIIVVAYGLLLPSAVLSIPTIMALNIHPSLLPRHRGATPIEASILAGNEVSGVSLIKMTPDLDAGDIVAMQEIPIADDDNRHSLGQKKLALSMDMLKEQLPKLLAGEFTTRPQDSNNVSYSKKIKKTDYQLHPASEDSNMVDRKMRAYYPKGFVSLPNGTRLQLLAGKKISGQYQQDNQQSNQQDIFCEGKKILLPCQTGAIELSMVQPENKKPMAAIDWWRGWRQ